MLVSFLSLLSTPMLSSSSLHSSIRNTTRRMKEVVPSQFLGAKFEWWEGRSTYNLESVGDNADGHQLLAVVAAVHHEGVGQSLNNRAVGLAEPLDGISASGVGDVDWVSQRNVVAVRFDQESN